MSRGHPKDLSLSRIPNICENLPKQLNICANGLTKSDKPDHGPCPKEGWSFFPRKLICRSARSAEVLAQYSKYWGNVDWRLTALTSCKLSSKVTEQLAKFLPFTSDKVAGKWTFSRRFDEWRTRYYEMKWNEMRQSRNNLYIIPKVQVNRKYAIYSCHVATSLIQSSRKRSTIFLPISWR